MQDLFKIILGLTLLVAFAFAKLQDTLPIENLQFADPKLSANVIARIPSARQIVVTSDRKLLIAGSLSGTVYAVHLSTDANGRLIQTPSTELVTVATGLSNAHGVAVDDASGDIYIGYADGISLVKAGANDIKKKETPVAPITLRSLPKAVDEGAMHNRRHLKLKGGRIYVSVGAPCDACEVSDPMGTIASFKYNTLVEADQDWRIEARGIRNSVGFSFHPTTGDLWFTDNGIDTADGSANDELNKIPANQVSAKHYGFPYCFDKTFINTEFNKNNTCSPYVAAENVLGSHVAALGMTFFSHNNKQTIVIAERGSMNITNPTGYRLTTVDPTNSADSSYKPFVTGFFTNGAAWGRPVDVFSTNDQLVVSDDKAGAIYGIALKDSASTTIQLASTFTLAMLFIVQLLVQFL